MTREGLTIGSKREKRVRFAALGILLLMGGLAIAGPSGLLAWSENLRLLDQRQAQIEELETQREELRNRVALLNPESADPDLAGELVKRNMNFVHEDEVVLILDKEGE